MHFPTSPISIDWNPHDASEIAVTTEGGELRLWDEGRGARGVRDCFTNKAGIKCMVLRWNAREAGMLAVGNSDGSCTLYNTVKRQARKIVPEEKGLCVVDLQWDLLSVSMAKHSKATRKEFEDHVQTLPEVMECYSVSGDRDYVLLILSRDMESYNEFLNSQILDHPSVHSASSSFALRRVKYTTALPLQD